MIILSSMKPNFNRQLLLKSRIRRILGLEILFQELFSSVQLLSHVWLFMTPWTTACQAPHPSPTPWVYSNSSTLSQWCHPTLSFSAVPFSSLPSIFPNIRVFSNESALCIRWPKYWSSSFNVTQDWSPLGWTGWISLLCKGVSRVFSNTTVLKH